jgi:predicted nuclease of predicted toxin-antitoxin system
LKLLVDNNLSPSLAHSLQPLFPEYQIVALREKFTANIADVEWINALSFEGGWAALTAERRLAHVPSFRQAHANLTRLQQI